MTALCVSARASTLLDMSLQRAAWHVEWAELAMTLPHAGACFCSCAELAAARVHAQLAHSRTADSTIDLRTDEVESTISL